MKYPGIAFLQCTANAAVDQCLLHNTKHAYDERLLVSIPGTFFSYLFVADTADRPHDSRAPYARWRYHCAGNSFKPPCSLLPLGSKLLQHPEIPAYYLSLVAMILQPTIRSFSLSLAGAAGPIVLIIPISHLLSWPTAYYHGFDSKNATSWFFWLDCALTSNTRYFV